MFAVIVAEEAVKYQIFYSGAPWVTKFGKLSIRENLVMT